MARFDGKRVLVTGGTRGIGRCIADGFAREGATLALNYRSDDRSAASALDELPGAGHVLLRADLADPAAAATLVEGCVGAMGGLDILVNNAGISIEHAFDESDAEHWRDAWERTLAANLMGPAQLCFAAARQMQSEGGGRIVAVSSRGAFRGEPTKPAYGASKAGLNALHQSLAVALAPHGVFVGIVAPGFVETELSAARLAGPDGDEIRGQSPFGRVARPEEVARAVLFLAEDGTEFLSGAIVDVNGASYLRS